MDIHTTRGSGALSKLDISQNALCPEVMKDGKWTMDYSGLTPLVKSMVNLKELNISSSNLRAEGARILAEDIKDMGALSKLKVNTYELPIQELKTATELDLSGKGLEVEDATIVSSCIK